MKPSLSHVVASASIETSANKQQVGAKTSLVNSPVRHHRTTRLYLPSVGCGAKGKPPHTGYRTPCLSTVRLRDLALPLFGTAHMDIKYTLGREQVSNDRALAAASAPARIAHEGMAAAYRTILAEEGAAPRSEADNVTALQSGSEVYSVAGSGRLANDRQSQERDAALVEGGQGKKARDVTRSQVVLTPGEAEPYKIVLENQGGRATEQPVSSIRQGEQLISEQTPRPPARDTLYDWPALPPEVDQKEVTQVIQTALAGIGVLGHLELEAGGVTMQEPDSTEGESEVNVTVHVSPTPKRPVLHIASGHPFQVGKAHTPV
jgi:hypothetical protein